MGREGNMSGTRAAATATREFLAGRKGIVLPKTVKMAGAEAWISDIPHKRTVPQRVRQKAIAKRVGVSEATISEWFDSRKSAESESPESGK